MPQINHPTDRPNFSIVNVFGITVAFSYWTMIGFQFPGRDWVIIENQWGPTTGKHLNWLDTRKEIRIPQKEFLDRFGAMQRQFFRDVVLVDLGLPDTLFDNRRIHG